MVVSTETRQNSLEKYCLCGCGELLPIHTYRAIFGEYKTVFSFIKEHAKRGLNGFNPTIHSPRLCLCGCGNLTTKLGGRFNRFIKGHENIGRVPWNNGKKFSKESRKKMSLARLGKEPANKAPLDLIQLHTLYVTDGKSISEVSVLTGFSKDSIKNRLRSLGWSRSTKETCNLPSFKERMRQLRIKTLTSKPVIETPNKLEKQVYDVLDKFRVSHERQAPLFGKFVVDILLPNNSLVIEIFGRYWHELSVNKRKDYSKKKYLERCGYHVEEIWDDEIKNFGVPNLLKKIFKKYNITWQE